MSSACVQHASRITEVLLHFLLAHHSVSTRYCDSIKQTYGRTFVTPHSHDQVLQRWTLMRVTWEPFKLTWTQSFCRSVQERRRLLNNSGQNWINFRQGGCLAYIYICNVPWLFVLFIVDKVGIETEIFSGIYGMSQGFEGTNISNATEKKTIWFPPQCLQRQTVSLSNLRFILRKQN